MIYARWALFHGESAVMTANAPRAQVQTMLIGFERVPYRMLF